MKRELRRDRVALSELVEQTEAGPASQRRIAEQRLARLLCYPLRLEPIDAKTVTTVAAIATGLKALAKTGALGLMTPEEALARAARDKSVPETELASWPEKVRARLCQLV